MIQLNLNVLIKYLRDKHYDAQLQSETQQIYIILKIAGREFPLFIRIFEQSDLLQLLVFMPINIKQGAYADLARLLHQLNKELDIPGFGMDESAGVVFYRCMLPVLDKKIEESLLDSFLKSISVICESICPPIFTVASGSASYAEIIAKAKEIKKGQTGFKTRVET
ncbi:MAG TPA: YbjN domain-containing protein [Waddliaceae bacterium]